MIRKCGDCPFFVPKPYCGMMEPCGYCTYWEDEVEPWDEACELWEVGGEDENS